MNFENIIEIRSVEGGQHSLILEISNDEYKKSYDQYNDNIASNIVWEHLEKRGDDGKPSDVQINYDKGDNIVRIKAKLNYLGNDHTEYTLR